MPKRDAVRARHVAPRLHPTVFAIRAVSCRPVDLGSCDTGQICRCEDGCDYVIKDTIGGAAPLLPHAEWFCSQLSDAAHIAVPPHKVILLPDKSHVFGSRWSGGVIKPVHGGHWFERVQDGRIDFKYASSVLSRVYAFDQFIHNPDRHLLNLLAHDQVDGFALLAMDYSRAWIINGFPLPRTPLPFCNTVKAQRWLRQLWGKDYINQQDVQEALENIQGIPVTRIRRIFDEEPNDWLPSSTKQAILKWWNSADMLARLKSIAAGVENGTYL